MVPQELVQILPVIGPVLMGIAAIITAIKNKK
jgi:hypothetical protein